LSVETLDQYAIAAWGFMRASGAVLDILESR